MIRFALLIVLRNQEEHDWWKLHLVTDLNAMTVAQLREMAPAVRELYLGQDGDLTDLGFTWTLEPGAPAIENPVVRLRASADADPCLVAELVHHYMKAFRVPNAFALKWVSVPDFPADDFAVGAIDAGVVLITQAGVTHRSLGLLAEALADELGEHLVEHRHVR